MWIWKDEEFEDEEVQPMKHYEVVAAVIEHDGKILCMQRNKAKFDYVSYKFEFPGGKVEAGEERHAALYYRKPAVRCGIVYWTDMR